MRINTKLKKAANFNPTKSTFQMSTEDLNKAIIKGEITLPLYQRDVSWIARKSIELLNYQLNGKAPVSAISFNKISESDEINSVVQVSLINRDIITKDKIKHGHYSVVDGQQRLTTNYKAYINHTDFRSIVLDLSKGDFRLVNDSIKEFQIPVGILLNKEEEVLGKYLKSNKQFNDFEIMGIIQGIRTKLKGYNYTINLANDLAEDEQIEWFEVLNNAGSRVTRIQMAFSKLKMLGIDIYTQYTKPFMVALQTYGLDNFDVKSTEVSIPIANLNPSYEIIKGIEHKQNFAPIPSDSKEKQLCKLEPHELKECFEKTLTALDKALSFIDKNELKEPSRLDFISYLTGYFVYHTNELTVDENNQLIEWYNNTNFSNQSNGTRRQMFADLIKK